MCDTSSMPHGWTKPTEFFVSVKNKEKLSINSSKWHWKTKIKCQELEYNQRKLNEMGNRVSGKNTVR